MSETERTDPSSQAHDDPEANPWTRKRYVREGRGLEFDRVSFFADAVYAIALTLIAVGIEAPELADTGSSDEMLEALGDLLPNIITYFVAFLVIGNYWLAHHRFMSTIDVVDSTFIRIHMLYLAIIAFLPFPAALIGRYDDNPIAIVVFSIAMAAASGLETLLMVHAQKANLYIVPLTDAGIRWSVMSSLSPVLIFALAAPLAFISPWLTIAAWFLNMPLGIMLGRRAPEDFRTS